MVQALGRLLGSDFLRTLCTSFVGKNIDSFLYAAVVFNIFSSAKTAMAVKRAKIYFVLCYHLILQSIVPFFVSTDN